MKDFRRRGRELVKMNVNKSFLRNLNPFLNREGNGVDRMPAAQKVDFYGE